MTISNWNGSNRCTPARVVAPHDLGELVAIVTDKAYPSPVRAVGELHSLNESIETPGTAVFMTHFDAIEIPKRVTDTVTVTTGAGVRMIDLNRALRKRGLQLPVVPEIGNATAGSVACCGTKDSSLGATGPGQISSTVVSVKMVNPNGCLIQVTTTSNPDLRMIRSSYGLLGLIYEVTFRVEPRKKVKYEYELVKLDRWLGAGTSIPPPTSEHFLGGADGFLGFLLPYRRELLVERRRLARHHTPIVLWDWVKLWLRSFAWASGARPFNAPLRWLPRRIRNSLTRGWIRLLDRGFLKWFFLGLIFRFSSFRADAMIDFKRPVSSYFDFTFWAFPVSTWDRVIPAYIDFCERFLRETGFRPALPTEVYFIRRDDSALLSFSADEDIFTLDLVNWTDEEPSCWREMNLAFNDFAAAHGARPLLNQTKHLLPSVARRVSTSGWYALAAARQAADPRGRFATPFLTGLLP